MAGMYHASVDEDRQSFELFAFRFHFRALTSLYFPPGKAGNVVRGALGNFFRKAVCVPVCKGAKTSGQRALCAYARLFEPTALSSGPSGLADWPRPFVFRAAHLDGRRFHPGQTFHFDLHVFEIRDPALPYFASSFSQLMSGGLGPGQARPSLSRSRISTPSGSPARGSLTARYWCSPSSSLSCWNRKKRICTVSRSAS